MHSGAGSSVTYDVLVILHVACAVLGFGTVAISGVYGFSVRRPDRPSALREGRRYFASPGRTELLIVAVPFLGVSALAVDPHGPGLAQVWPWVAAGVWAVATGLLLGVVRPAERAIRAALVPDGDLEAAGRAVGPAGGRLGWASVTTDVAFVVALLLMVFQPGR